MTGGQLQLNSYKRNDSFLTVNPQKTFFRKVYHQYNNFAKINFTIDFTHIRKGAKFNEINNFNLTIPKYGHLIKECYIYLTLPKIFNDNYHIKWIKDLQFKIIKNIRFKIGGTVIQEFNSDLLYFYYTLLSTEKKELFNKTTNREYLNNLGSKLSFIPETNLLIPIPVWFFDVPFPLTCLEFENLEIDLDTNSIYDLILVREKNYEKVHTDSEIYINTSPWRRMKDTEYKSILDSSFKLNPILKLNYLFLEENELINYFVFDNKIFIEKYNKIDLKDIANQKAYNKKKKLLKYDYDTFGQTRYIFLFIKKMGNCEKYNQHFNFTNLDCLDNSSFRIFQNLFLKLALDKQKITKNSLLESLEKFIIDDQYTEKSINTVDYAFLSEIMPNTSTVNVNFSEAFRSNDISTLREEWKFRYISGDYSILPFIDSSFKKDIIDSLKLKFNNIERIETQGKELFQNLEFYKNFGSSNNNSFYTINFSMFPDKRKPSGHCNFSHIRKVTLDLKLNLEPDEIYNMTIYNKYYNILHLYNGSAKLIYFK